MSAPERVELVQMDDTTTAYLREDVAAAQLAEVRAERDRYREALVAIQAHGVLNDNEQSMVWTARVGLDPSALGYVPEPLRDVVALRFAALSFSKGEETDRG